METYNYWPKVLKGMKSLFCGTTIISFCYLFVLLLLYHKTWKRYHIAIKIQFISAVSKATRICFTLQIKNESLKTQTAELGGHPS